MRNTCLDRGSEGPKCLARMVAWRLWGIEPNVKRVEKELGPIDILVNNTGGPAPSLAAETPIETWRQQFDAMVASVIAVTGAVLPSMRRRRWGRHHQRFVRRPHADPQSCGLERASIGSRRMVEDARARSGARWRHRQCRRPGRIATARVRSLDEARAAREGRTVEEVAAASAADIPRSLWATGGIRECCRVSRQRSVVLCHGIAYPGRRRPHPEHLTGREGCP